MKGWQKISCAVGTGILLMGIGVGSWQKEKLAILYKGMKYSEVELGERVTETKAQVEEALNQYDLGYIRDLTVEEEEQIRTGKLSSEEAMQQVMNEENYEKVAQEVPKEQQIVASYTTQMYTLKAKYLGLLGNLEEEGMAALRGIPKAERTLGKLQSVGMPYVNQGFALERTCDGEVSELLGGLEEELVGIGADTDIVETMRSAYATEKQLKMASYIAKAKAYKP